MDTITDAVERNEHDPLPPSRSGDRWLFVAPYVTLIATFCLMLLCGLPGLLSFILIPITVLGGPPMVVALLVWAASLLVRKRWRSGASVFVAAVLPVLLLQPISWAADFVHLGLTVGLGVGELNDTLPPVDSRFQAHDWSVGLAGGPDTFLLYDETDEIAWPLARRRNHIVPDESVEKECAGSVRHLVGHYYVCSF